MEASYKHSYKTGENLLNSLSVYNVGYQKCDPEYQWGPGVRDHYCIHHILSGSGCYCTGTVSKHLEEGDTFILYPGVELRYQADADKPWEYAWAGFMGADAASLIRNTEFSRETPYILKGRIPTEKIRDGLERIYNAKGNTYEAAVAMTGEMYSLLAVFMHYAEHEEKEKARSHIIGVLVAERYVKEFPSFYMEIYRRVAQETAKRGHVTVLEVVTCEKENLSADAMVFLEQSMDGLIVIGELYQGYMKMLRKVSRIPIVCVDYYDVYDDMDYIITDGFGGMEQMTRLLLKEGYRDLIFVGSPNATKNITDRYFGYCKAMQRAGMEEEQFRFIADRECGKGNYRLEFELPEKLPQGFVCNCDKTAVLLIERLKERGVRVPEDVSIVSFDNYYPQIQDGIKLCTYENDEKVIARISVSTLLKRIEGKSRPEGVRIVEGRVVPGNTVRFRGDC